MIFVWLAVYRYSGVNSIKGVTLSAIVAYMFVIGSIASFSTIEIARSISGSIQSGGIIKLLIRPIKYPAALIASKMPGLIIYSLFGSVPVLALIYVLGGMHLGAFAILGVAIEIVMAWLIGNLLGFIIGFLSMYITGINGIVNAMSWLLALLGGAIMPTILYPKVIYSMLMLTPFPFLYYIPAGTFTGMLPVYELPALLAEGFAWIGMLAILAFLAWRRASRKIAAVGV